MADDGEIDARVAVLEGLALFGRTARPVLEEVARLIDAVQVPAGTNVVTQGDTADALWILADGEVSVAAADAEIRTLSAPAYFGEVATLTGVPRLATVSTTTPCTLWRIASQDFLYVIGPGNTQ